MKDVVYDEIGIVTIQSFSSSSCVSSVKMTAGYLWSFFDHFCLFSLLLCLISSTVSLKFIDANKWIIVTSRCLNIHTNYIAPKKCIDVLNSFAFLGFELLNPYLGDFGNVMERHFWTKNPELLFRFWWRHTWPNIFCFMMILNYVSNTNYTLPGEITWRHR